jgi:hypothetical protein
MFWQSFRRTCYSYAFLSVLISQYKLRTFTNPQREIAAAIVAKKNYVKDL